MDISIYIWVSLNDGSMDLGRGVEVWCLSVVLNYAWVCVMEGGLSLSSGRGRGPGKVQTSDDFEEVSKGRITPLLRSSHSLGSGFAIDRLPTVG